MSASINRLLCDPEEATLLTTLEQAGGRAFAWEHLLDAIATELEGRTQLESNSANPPRHLAAAWWTDHAGRKHIRVVAGAVDRDSLQIHFSLMDEDQRPPWWHIGPERAYRVPAGPGEGRWVACCDCGEVGPPRQLGWAGDCCGPCHDRREEGFPLEAARLPHWFWRLGPIYSLAFAPVGDRLAVSSSARAVAVYDFPGRGPRLLHANEGHETYREIRPLHFSPDGTLLAGFDEHHSRLVVWLLEDVDSPPVSFAIGPRVEARGLAFSRDNLFLACLSDSGDLRIWDRAGWKDVYLTRRVTAMDFSPDGRTLALGSHGGEVRFLQTGSWEVRERAVLFALPDEDVLFLEYTPDGRHLVTVTGREDNFQHREPWQLRLYSLAGDRAVIGHQIPFVSSLALTPDGRHLAWIVHDDQHSPAAVHFWDLQSWRSAGWLEWDPEDNLQTLAFSPDGQTMATGSELGVVKLWPWRRLLA